VVRSMILVHSNSATAPSNFSLASIPAPYYSAIAAAILLLAWSVDNLIQKRIAATQQVLAEFKGAELQANYWRSTLHVRRAQTNRSKAGKV
jgi:hypothetical protein